MANGGVMANGMAQKRAAGVAAAYRERKYGAESRLHLQRENAWRNGRRRRGGISWRSGVKGMHQCSKAAKI